MVLNIARFDFLLSGFTNSQIHERADINGSKAFFGLLALSIGGKWGVGKSDEIGLPFPPKMPP